MRTREDASLKQRTSPPQAERPSHQPPKGRTSEYYDALLRRIHNITAWDGAVPLAVGVTSCKPRQGTSTVAANLAIAAANVAKTPVLLVDANASRPSLSRTFRVRHNEGLINALVGDADAFHCVVDSGLHNLSLMLRGKTDLAQRPSYGPSDISELIDMLKHVFNLIVFDLEHASELTTCFAFAPRMDGLLLVLEANRVDRGTLVRRQKQLKDMQVNLLGIVFNKYDG
jgi:capsular exopolysaccharide synthesis family protein